LKGLETERPSRHEAGEFGDAPRQRRCRPAVRRPLGMEQHGDALEPQKAGRRSTLIFFWSLPISDVTVPNTLSPVP
jgi:hypothetical protein